MLAITQIGTRGLWKIAFKYSSACIVRFPHSCVGFIKESMGPGLVCGSHPKGTDGCNSSCSVQSLRTHLVQSLKEQQIQFQGSLDHIRNDMTMWCKASVWCKFTLMVPFYVKDINSFTSEYFALIIHTINVTCTGPEHRGKHLVCPFLGPLPVLTGALLHAQSYQMSSAQ